MSEARKFNFGADFSEDRRPGGRRADEEALRAAEASGYARGVADGRTEAERADAHRLAVALERLVEAAAQALARLAAETDRLEARAAALTIAFARKLAGAAIEHAPLAQLQAAAAECFRELNGVPHVAVRVPDDLIDAAKTQLGKLAAERGFAGRIIVLGEPTMGPGDFRFEWADGGVARDGTELNRLIDEALARHGRAPADTTPHREP
ncbi:FliH/SctL family protein [Alsobacter sp. SYSU M60028]|uniref:FliH/SctL family protein n=1 Tax=Alsobacter ponti TaxID=2962936 RepID=A0ABT1LHF6_9HYPH|nr:FliH/SctL family protein [Alsobacter ponti]MCP8940942.1 FliH/SctL family protein [Alsobacter ponti]